MTEKNLLFALGLRVSRLEREVDRLKQNEIPPPINNDPPEEKCSAYKTGLPKMECVLMFGHPGDHIFSTRSGDDFRHALAGL